METNNLKQKAIEAAYGEYYQKVWSSIDVNGFIRRGKLSYEEIGLNENEIEHLILIDVWRPKSLAGIETNNGWIRIDSENDLPEQGGEYHVVIKGKLDKAVYIKSNRWLVNGNDYPKTTQTHGISHYQPIIKPKPPIF